MLYSFDEFELSEQEFSLSRQGKRIPLEPRALHVLLVLVKSQGRLLSKSALLETVWKDTFVEETTLTRIIAILRKQLEDDSRAPRYIETVPTRGYRFIAAVKTLQPPDPEPEVAHPPLPTPVEPVEVLIETAPPAPPDSSQKPTRRNVWLYGAVAACIVLVAAFFFLRERHRRALLSTKDTIVLTDFSNTSGDPVFDDALRQGMLVQLEQSPVLRLASDGRIRRTLKLMGLQLNAPVSSEVGREVCQRIGGTVVLDGSISKLGDVYVLGLRARRCTTGEQLDAEQAQVKRKEDVLGALSELATRFRNRLGEAHASVEDLDTPLAEATTSSLDALKAFSQATKIFSSKGSAAAVPLFQHATELDPQFAMAHVWLGRMYADLGAEAASIESTKKAYALRERSSERERFSIDVSYDLLVLGNLERARNVCDAWIQMYPRDTYAHSFLSALIFPAYGQYERGLEEAKTTVAIDPDFVLGYRNAALNLIALNRVGEAEAVLQQAVQRRLFLPSFPTNGYRIAFLKGDAAGMKRAADAAPTNPWLLHYQAATLAQAGHMAQARTVDEQALNLARYGSRKELEAQLLVVAAFTETLYGYSSKGSELVGEAARLSSSRDVEYASALILAMTGNLPEASKQSQDLLQRFPEDTLVRYNYVPTVEAVLALGRKQPQVAVDLLRQASQFEMSGPLYPVYVRGQAFLALGEYAQAAAEFKKIGDHPGVVLNDPLLNLAELNLAASYAHTGNRPEAAAVLNVLAQRWKDADHDIPVLQRMKREQTALTATSVR